MPLSPEVLSCAGGGCYEDTVKHGRCDALGRRDNCCGSSLVWVANQVRCGMRRMAPSSAEPPSSALSSRSKCTGLCVSATLSLHSSVGGAAPARHPPTLAASRCVVLAHRSPHRTALTCVRRQRHWCVTSRLRHENMTVAPPPPLCVLTDHSLGGKPITVPRGHSGSPAKATWRKRSCPLTPASQRQPATLASRHTCTN